MNLVRKKSAYKSSNCKQTLKSLQEEEGEKKNKGFCVFIYTYAYICIYKNTQTHYGWKNC